MFGFNKKKPLIEGPIEFSAEVEIDRSASDVFPLLDIADPNFAHAQRGANVAPASGSEGQYELTMEGMDGVTFHFQVLERVAGVRHKVECVIKPQINDLMLSVEDHTIEALGDNACRVVLNTTATFNESLSDEEIAGEVAMMSMAVQDDLLKLKVHAEDGLDAVLALDEEGFDIDLGEFEFDGIDLTEIDLGDLGEEQQ